MNDFSNILSEDNFYHQFEIQDSIIPQNVNNNDDTNFGPNSFFSQPSFEELQQQQEFSQNGLTTSNLEFPFVRIHAFDTPKSIVSSNSYFQNVEPLATTTTGNREVKPKIESIKFELNDSIQVVQLSSKITAADEVINSNSNKTKNLNSHQNQQPELSFEKIQLFKCDKCMFLTIQEENLECHKAAHNDIIHKHKSKTEFKCPGCDNIFNYTISLYYHLKNDHFMIENEISKYFESLKANIPAKKNGIYLKNVELFSSREQSNPSQIYNINEDDLLAETNVLENDLTFINLIGNENDENSPPIEEVVEKHGSISTQKILIKNVENLCESNCLAQPTEKLNNSKSKCHYEEEITKDCIIDENPPRRKPKIYIKNVDILKEPIFLPPTNVSNILNVNETLHFNIFPQKQIDLPMSETCQLHEKHQFSTNSNSNDKNNHLKKFEQYSKNNLPLKNSQQTTSQNKLNSNKKSTNAIHLRTVDELNLMNKNQLNLMNNLHQNDYPQRDNLNLVNDLNVDESWSDFSNGFENIDNVIDSNSNSLCTEQKNGKSLQNNLFNTPHNITTNESLPTDYDDEILLVCAEDLISNNDDLNVINCENNFDKNDYESNINICDKNYKEMKEYVENHLMSGIEKDKIEQASNEMENNSNVNMEYQNIDLQNHTPIPEKGRIYVSENLMANSNKNCTIDKLKTEKKLKKSKGRPTGSKTNRMQNVNFEFKCDFSDCSYKFKMNSTLEYHKKCHSSGSDSSHGIECPECHENQFSSWNTLYTHLWRCHEIDMELYNCELCNFKTPILSRLLNTHSKIHSIEKNFKCDQCDKAFKNSKQLKNHRRIHRIYKSATTLQKCDNCPAIFSNIKAKNDHFCQQQQIDASPNASKCTVCDKLCSSKSALKLHTLTHQKTIKFKCNNCEYGTNDHNAFRRHKSTHDKTRKYECSFCGYKCIQSVLYKKHINLKHPDFANEIIHKCFCSFTTINLTQFYIHVAKHDYDSDVIKDQMGNNLYLGNAEPLPNENLENRLVNKIKVKSNLTDPSKFLLQT